MKNPIIEQPISGYPGQIYRYTLPISEKDFSDEHKLLLNDWWRNFLDKSPQEISRWIDEKLAADGVEGEFGNFFSAIQAREIVIYEDKVWASFCPRNNSDVNTVPICIMPEPLAIVPETHSRLVEIGGQSLANAARYLQGLHLGPDQFSSSIDFSIDKMQDSPSAQGFDGRSLLITSVGDIFFAGSDNKVMIWHFSPYNHQHGRGIEKRFDSVDAFFAATFKSVLKGNASFEQLGDRE